MIGLSLDVRLTSSTENPIPAEERRRAKRAPADFVIELEILGCLKYRARARDIGPGGMFIETDEPPEHGSFVLVTIPAPVASDPVRLPATVRWRAKRGFGVQFCLLKTRETRALSKLIAKQCEEGP